MGSHAPDLLGSAPLAGENSGPHASGVQPPRTRHRGLVRCVERWMAFASDGRRVVPHLGAVAGMERMVPPPNEPRYLRTAQVAELLHVSPKTVSRWAQEGRLLYLRTLGGHRRYPDAEIRALLETLSEPSGAGQPPAWSP
jgi:excisionase family DNA binding protein